MILSEQQICKIVCSNPPACTCTDNCPIRFTIESVHKAVEAQHKRDCEEFQKQKQEMWEESLELDKELNITDADKAIMLLNDFKHKWGIELVRYIFSKQNTKETYIEEVRESFHCSTAVFKRDDLVPVDIDEVWHDWFHKWIDCSGEIVKPFPEYLQERVMKNGIS